MGSANHTVDTSDKTLKGRQPPPCSIRQTLALGDHHLYADFYAVLERLMAQEGFIDMHLQSPSQRHTMRKDLTQLLIDDSSLFEQFHDTFQIIESEPGQHAFRLLIYKVRSNYRRRAIKQQARKDRKKDGPRQRASPRATAIKQGPLQPSAQGYELRSMPMEQTASHPRASSPLLFAMIRVMRPSSGSVKIVCRSSDLIPLANNKDRPCVDDLSWTKFISILRSDLAFEPDTEHLTWDEGNGSRQDSIDNERQWRAVISHQLNETGLISFIVRPNLRISRDGDSDLALRI